MEFLHEVAKDLENVKCLTSERQFAEARKLLSSVIIPKMSEYSSKSENFGSDHLKFIENALCSCCLENNQEIPKCDDDFENKSNSDKKNLDSFSADRSSVIKNTIVNVDVEQNFQNNVVGLQNAKQALTEAIVDPVKYPQWFTNGRKPWRAILLYGPPGTGKSRLAQALAGEIQSAVVYNVSSTDIVSTWMGQSEKLIRDLFNDAINCKRTALIFIDEIDSLCRARSAKEEEGTRRLKTEFLLQIERVRNETKNVFLLGATNCPWEMDSAFLRRFQKRIFIGLPDKVSRIEILKRMLSGVKIDSDDWLMIGEKTNGLSGSDIGVLSQEILYRPLRELRTAKKWRRNLDGTYSPSILSENYGSPSFNNMTMDDLPKELIRPRDVETLDVLASLANIQRTVSDEDLTRFREFTEKFGLIG